MNLGQMFPSSYLKKEDVLTPVVVPIVMVIMEDVAGDGGKESKPVLKFGHTLKPMILNRGNAETIAAIYGDDTSAWVGRNIEVFNDPSVMFAGKRTGGVRVRAPQGPQPPQHNGYGPPQQPQHAGYPPQYGPAAHNNGYSNPQPPTQPLWDVSDGVQMMKRQTTDQVKAFLGQQPNLAALKVRSHPVGAAVMAADWMKEMQMLDGEGGGDDVIPF